MLQRPPSPFAEEARAALGAEWEEHEATWLKPPYNLDQNARLLAARLARDDDAARRDALRGLGIARVLAEKGEIARLLVASRDPSTREALEE